MRLMVPLSHPCSRDLAAAVGVLRKRGNPVPAAVWEPRAPTESASLLVAPATGDGPRALIEVSLGPSLKSAYGPNSPFPCSVGADSQPH
jgi:hypothetical protein